MMAAPRPLCVALFWSLSAGCGTRIVTTPDADPAALDADGDGVTNEVDVCPEIPARTADGCPSAAPAVARAGKDDDEDECAGEAEEDCGGEEATERREAARRVTRTTKPREAKAPARTTVAARERERAADRVVLPAAPGAAQRKARAVAIIRALQTIQREALDLAVSAETCADLALILRAWVERHDEEGARMVEVRGKRRRVTFSDIMRLSQEAEALELPPKEAIGEVAQAFSVYGDGLTRWDSLEIVDRCARDPALATIDREGIGRTLGSLPTEIDDLFQGAGRFIEDLTRGAAAKSHARGLELMRGMLRHLDAFTRQAEAAEGCAALLAVVRAWNGDGGYQKLEVEAQDLDFPWQDRALVLDATHAEATRLNARYSARFVQLVERLEAQSACFDTSEGDGVARAFFPLTPLQNFETID